MQVGSSSGKFSGWVNFYPVSSARDANELSFGLHFAAAYASPLGDMFNTLGRLLFHLMTL